MKVEEFRQRSLRLAGWDVHLTTYRLGEIWHCKADNDSPGAALARTTGSTREEAEARAIERAERQVAHTRRHVIEPG